MQKVKTSYENELEGNIPTLIVDLESGVTGNIIFPGPFPTSLITLTNFLLDGTKLRTYLDIPHPDPEQTAIKNALLNKCVLNLGFWCVYENTVCMGDDVKLKSTKMPLTKVHEPQGELAAPAWVKFSDGPNPGTIAYEIAVAPKQGVTYVIRYTTDPLTIPNPNYVPNPLPKPGSEVNPPTIPNPEIHVTTIPLKAHKGILRNLATKTNHTLQVCYLGTFAGDDFDKVNWTPPQERMTQ